MANNTIFDDVFRTMLEKMPELIIPLINEVFGTDYPADIPIVQKRNEHYTENGKIITDSHLYIAGKMYHIECQSTSDSSMIIRMVEYDFAVALEAVEKENEKYRMYFPHSCVLYLRGKNGPEQLEMELIMPDGQCLNYRVPVIRVEQYTQDIIFQKKLLFLLPFYIIRYEKIADTIEKDRELFRSLMDEYTIIEQRLEQALLPKGKEKEYRDLIELISRIADYIFAKSDRTKKGIGEIMGGKVLELESDKLIERGMQQGMQQGLADGQLKAQSYTATRMLQSGKYSIEEIIDLSGLSVDKINEIKTRIQDTHK